MKITLANFQDFVPSKIWKRGMDYYESDSILSLEEDNPGEWRAVVEGTDDYSVTVVLDGDEVMEWECDCPYDGGDICKHVVAVVAAIRDGEFMNPRKTAALGYKHSEIDERSFEELLSTACEEDLRQIVGEYSLKDERIRQFITDYFQKKNAGNNGAQVDYCERVRDVFSSASLFSRHFARSYSEPELDWESVCIEMETLFGEAERLLEKGDVRAAVDVPLVFFREVDNNADDGLLYDSSCDVNDACDRAGRLLVAALRTGLVEDAGKVLTELRRIAKTAAYTEYSIYERDELLEQAGLAIMSDEDALEHLDAILERHKTSFDLYGYVFQKVGLLKKMGRDGEAEKVMDKYLYLSEVRKRRFEELRAAGKTGDALKLLDEGIAVASQKRHSGDVDMWLEKKLEIFEELNDVPASVDICRKLFVSKNGSIGYYQKLKNLIDSSEWRSFLADMIGQTKSSSFAGHNVIADIYLKEKDYDSLLSLLSEDDYYRLELLDNYACRFPKSYSLALIPLFVASLKQCAMNNVGRSHYVRIARTLHDMKKLSGGREAASELAAEFRQLYKRRPAMLDELKGL